MATTAKARELACFIWGMMTEAGKVSVRGKAMAKKFVRPILTYADEAHHVPADTYQKVMKHFTPKLWLGMTATPDTAWVAADLLSQAEHDKMASAVLVTDSRELAQAVSREIEAQLQTLEREEIARASIEANGKIIVARSLTQAAAVANRIAPEHLELSVDNPFDYLGLIENAGSIFLGRYNPEPMGDYFAGPNHTLPTMGTARFYSPLSVDDFIKKSQFSYYTREALEKDYWKVSRFAKEEGLTAHARAVDIRFEKEGEA